MNNDTRHIGPYVIKLWTHTCKYQVQAIRTYHVSTNIQMRIDILEPTPNGIHFTNDILKWVFPTDDVFIVIFHMGPLYIHKH